MGSDNFTMCGCDGNIVSIHAPTWGATFVRRQYTQQESFNPRSHMGSDASKGTSKKAAQFQSTLPHGERPVKGRHCARCMLFQSTLPHGERPKHSTRFSCLRCFNPRSHMGSDSSHRACISGGNVSIHAPTWGATQRIIDTLNCHWFQSTLPHGERQEFLKCFIDLISFNPRSHMGSDT